MNTDIHTDTKASDAAIPSPEGLGLGASPVRLFNAITEALREMDKCPDDSVQDIWNESLESWETGLRMNHLLEITPEVPRKSPRKFKPNAKDQATAKKKP